MMKKLWMFSLLFLAVTTLFVACGESEEAACGTDDDCANNQVCEDGACKTVSQVRCTGNPDCPGGQQCVDAVCRPLPDPDMSTTNNENNQNNVNNADDMGMDMSDPDNVNPEVVSIEPTDGTDGVALDATITVTFSEPLDLFTVNNQSLLLKSPAGNVATMVDYDAETNSATITPTNPLLPATGYRVQPTAFLKDVAGNTLRIAPDPSTRFYTTIEEPAHHTAIAEKFAPVIYQAIDDTSAGQVNRDIPTTVDFDGNYRARDNKANALRGVTRTEASVYYSVVESHTHYFITYALYYPIRRIEDQNFEHDFTGAVFVIDKETEAFKLVEGIRVGMSADEVIAYKPNSSDVSGTGGSQFFESFEDSFFEGDRYPLFVTRNVHQACNWYKDGSNFPPLCQRSAEQFGGAGTGVKMTPGEAQTFQDAMDTDSDSIPEMTYALVPLSTTLWARRSSVSNEGLWELLSVYTPIDDRPATYPVTMEPVLWTNRLVSDDESSFGKPPMAWFKLSADSNEGQWLYDPAYLLTVRYNFGTDYSTDYCYNYFLGLDSLDDPAVAACATPSEG